MVPKRSPSEANAELAQWLSQQGHPTTAREIRTWRENKWVAPAIVEPQGYARPTKTANPPEAFEQALAVAQIKGGKRTSPQTIAFGLFVRGHPIGIEQIHQAYSVYFEDLRRTLAKLVDPNADAFEAGEQIAAAVGRFANRTKAGRYMLKNAKKLGESPKSIVESALTVVFTGMFGGSVSALSEPPSMDVSSAMDELHSVTGMRGFVDEPIVNSGSIVASHEDLRADNVRVFEHFTLDALEETGRTASLDNLITGRDQAVVMLRFMGSFARTTALTSGPAMSFGLSFVATLDTDDGFVALMSLLIAVLDAWMPGRVEALMPLWRVEADRHAALLELLEASPKRLRKYLAVNGPPWTDVPEHIQVELTELTDNFKQAHPELVEMIIRPPVDLEELST